LQKHHKSNLIFLQLFGKARHKISCIHSLLCTDKPFELITKQQTNFPNIVWQQCVAEVNKLIIAV